MYKRARLEGGGGLSKGCPAVGHTHGREVRLDLRVGVRARVRARVRVRVRARVMARVRVRARVRARVRVRVRVRIRVRVTVRGRVTSPAAANAGKCRACSRRKPSRHRPRSPRSAVRRGGASSHAVSST